MLGQGSLHIDGQAAHTDTCQQLKQLKWSQLDIGGVEEGGLVYLITLSFT